MHIPFAAKEGTNFGINISLQIARNSTQAGDHMISKKHEIKHVLESLLGCFVWFVCEREGELTSSDTLNKEEFLVVTSAQNARSCGGREQQRSDSLLESAFRKVWV